MSLTSRFLTFESYEFVFPGKVASICIHDLTYNLGSGLKIWSLCRVCGALTDQQTPGGAGRRAIEQRGQQAGPKFEPESCQSETRKGSLKEEKATPVLRWSHVSLIT